MSDRATLKSFFETNDFPTQPQFADFIDSTPNFDDDGTLVGAQDDLVALAGGGQAGATLVNKRIARFITVASVNDSGILLSAIAGNNIHLLNDGANSMNVFPAVGEEIDGGGVNVATAVFQLSSINLRCYTTGEWRTA